MRAGEEKQAHSKCDCAAMWSLRKMLFSKEKEKCCQLNVILNPLTSHGGCCVSPILDEETGLHVVTVGDSTEGEAGAAAARGHWLCQYELGPGADSCPEAQPQQYRPTGKKAKKNRKNTRRWEKGKQENKYAQQLPFIAWLSRSGRKERRKSPWIAW